LTANRVTELTPDEVTEFTPNRVTDMRRNARERWSMSRLAQKVRNLGSMTERPPADLRPSPAGWQFQISKLLVTLFVAAVAATGALVITLLTGLSEEVPAGSGPNGLPPPPPSMRPGEILTVVTGLFVLAWLAVLVVFARDQVLLRLRRQQPPATGPGGGVTREELTGLLADLRSELAKDRAGDNAAFGERLAELTGEYGERRETDGYLSGMRMATSDDPSPPNVRALRRTPPQR
jgi:hypothetical protein